MSDKNHKDEIVPLRANNSDFGPAVAKYHQFSVNIPAGMADPEKTLVDHRYWVNFAPRLEAGSEVRCVADDNAFYAVLYVVSKTGNDLKLKLVNFVELFTAEEVADWDIDMFQGYRLMNGGRGGYYAKVVSTGERVQLPQKGYSTPKELVNAMEEYLRALVA